MKRKKLLLRGARQLVTLRGPAGPRRGAGMSELSIIHDGSLFVQEGIISAVGPTRRLENLAEARDAEELDAAGRVVMPGFVDSHTHLVCGPPRVAEYEMRIRGATYQEIAAAGGGIRTSLEQVRALPVSRLRHQARQALMACIRHGTTTLEAKSGYGLDESAELKTLRVIAALDGDGIDIVPTYLGAHIVPPEYQGRADEYIDWVCAHMLPRIARRKLAWYADVYCDPHAFSLAQARRYLEAARQLRFGLKLHAAQFAAGDGAVCLGVELGATSVDHLEQAGEADAARLSQSPTVATLLPGAVFHLGLPQYAPARRLIDAGAAVALATDFNPGTSPTYSMPMVLSLACTQMRMSPAEAVTAATINGAHALGMDRRCGSLEYGKQADLLLLNAADYRELPYHFGSNLVHATMKRGEIVYREGTVRLCQED